MGASLKGQLLIASPTILDPNFRRTVILMTEHGDEGAMGLILNRAAETTVGEDGTFTPFHLQVLTIGPSGVEHVGAFFEEKLFTTFGLPASLPADFDPAASTP